MATIPDTVVLVTCDGQKFQVTYDLVKRSGVIKNMIECLGNCTDGVEVPVMAIHSRILKKVIGWLEANEEKPVNERPEEYDDIDEATQKFLKEMDQNTIFELIHATNFLDIVELLNVCCMKIAHNMKGKSVEELREMFNLPDDFTEEEKEEIRNENAWIFDLDQRDQD